MAPAKEGSGSSVRSYHHIHNKLASSGIVNSVNSFTVNDSISVQMKLNGLQEDLSELIHILHATERSSVKEIIQADIQSILLKIESLEDRSTQQLETNVSWSRVAQLKCDRNKYRDQQTPYPSYLTSNRYELLNDNVNQEEDLLGKTNGTSDKKQLVNCSKKPKTATRTKKSVRKRSHKVLIIGDSHTRGCASEVKLRVKDECDVIGFSNPGSSMQAIKESAITKISHLTKEDFIVLWGGSIDVAKNNSATGIKQILDLAINATHTNVIQLSVPHRHDLLKDSCVNKEVRNFNINLQNKLGRFNNVTMIEVPKERDLYTRHGQHLNAKGKETMASKIALTIENIIQTKANPIPMNWSVTNGIDMQEQAKQAHENPTSANVTNTLERSDHLAKGNITNKNSTSQVDTTSTEHESTRFSSRVRKIPTTRYNDFLWIK